MELKPFPRREAKRYDCGRFGCLTVREIARLTGRNETTIRNRIARGVCGEALASNPPKRSAAKHYREQMLVGNTHGGMFIACRIARSLRTKDDIPTIHQLMDRFDMSRATAYRWRAAWLAAMGIDRA